MLLAERSALLRPSFRHGRDGNRYAAVRSGAGHRHGRAPFDPLALVLAVRGPEAAGVLLVVTLVAVLPDRSRSSPLTRWAVDLPGSGPIVATLAFGAAVLLMVAVHGVVRFSRRGDTYGGIVAGLLLAAVVFWDLRMVVPVALLVLAGAVIAQLRLRREAGAGIATACVLAFPTLATLLCWAFLQWRLSGGLVG